MMARSLILAIMAISSSLIFNHGTMASDPFSCKGRCKESSDYISCGCDVRCLTLGDCCLDFKTFCPKIFLLALSENNWIKSLASLKRPKKYIHFSKCVSVPYLQNMSTVPPRFMMVSSCPQNSHENQTVVDCTGGLSPVESYTGIVFRNVFCALCHGFNLENVCPWKLMEEGIPHSYMARRNFWAYNSCQKGLVKSSCPNGTEPQDTEKDCNSYVQPLLSIYSNLTYKNEFCARCHGEDLKASQLVNSTYPLRKMVKTEDVTDNCYDTSGQTCRETRNIYSCVINLLSNLTLIETCAKNMKITYISDSAAKLELVSNRLSFAKVVDEIKLAKLSPDDCSIYVTAAIFNKRRGLSIIKYVGLAGTNQTWNVTAKNGSTCKQICFWERRQLDARDFEIKEPCKRGGKETIKSKKDNGPLIKDGNFDVSEDMKTICTCLGDTSNFAIIARYVHLVFAILSLLCLVVVVWIHVRFPRLQNLYGFCLICLSVTLGASFILSVIQIITDFFSTDFAIVLTIIRHYIWLSVFSWGTVIMYHVYRRFAINVIANKLSILTIRSQSLRYAIFAWGLPIPFVITGMIYHFRVDNFEYTRHWLTSEHTLPFFIFIIPALCLSLIGICLFFATLSKMDKMRKGSEEFCNHNTDILFIALRLQLTLGIPWISFLFLLVSNHPLKLPIVSTINSLQGILIMVAFVTTKKIKNLLRQRNRTYPTAL